MEQGNSTLVIEAQQLADGFQALVLTRYQSYEDSERARRRCGLLTMHADSTMLKLPEQPMRWAEGRLRFASHGEALVFDARTFLVTLDVEAWRKEG